MNDGLLLMFAACILGGSGLLIWSWVDRRKRDWLAGISETDLAAAAFGATSAVTGITDAPSLLASPVSNTPCVYYEKQVDVQPTGRPRGAGNAIEMGVNLGVKLVWMRESVEHVGGFFLTNGSSKVFVLPRGATLRARRETSMQDPNTVATRRITERVIVNGQAVCVIGRPRSVEELMAVIRKDAAVTPELLRLLQSSGPMSCYFDDGGGTFMVADGTFSDLKADAAESAGTLFWAGLGMLGMGAFIAIVLVLSILKVI